MNQQKYIMSAVLILIIGTLIYLTLRKFPHGKDFENTSIIIDYDEPPDTFNKFTSEGKRIFNSQCASCHHVVRDGTGPALFGVMERGSWRDTIILYKYIRDPQSFIKSKYIDSLRQAYGSNHIAFPNLTNNEIQAILKYVSSEYRNPMVNIVD